MVLLQTRTGGGIVGALAVTARATCSAATSLSDIERDGALDVAGAVAIVGRGDRCRCWSGSMLIAIVANMLQVGLALQHASSCSRTSARSTRSRASASSSAAAQGPMQFGDEPR